MDCPSTLGRYELIRPLGQGGMATVYLARDPRVGRLVAIKVLGPHLAADPVVHERFEREAQVVASLEHHSIVPLYDYGAENGVRYLVFRYMEGGSLAERLREGPLDVDVTTRLVTRAADALDYAHERQVVHRDIKPANILFDAAGNAYLSDFGIACVANAATRTSWHLAGTPAYMCPEQIDGARPGAVSDVYALGCATFEALTGRPPFEGDTFAVVLARQLHSDPAPPSHVNPMVSPSVDDVVIRAMAKDPDQRWPSAGAFATAMGSTVASARSAPTLLGSVAAPDSAVPPALQPVAAGARGESRAMREERHHQFPLPRRFVIGGLILGAFIVALVIAQAAYSFTAPSVRDVILPFSVVLGFIGVLMLVLLVLVVAVAVLGVRLARR